MSMKPELAYFSSFDLKYIYYLHHQRCAFVFGTRFYTGGAILFQRTASELLHLLGGDDLYLGLSTRLKTEISQLTCLLPSVSALVF